MNVGYINGKFIDFTEKVIPIEERGHQFGDGVYEVVKFYNQQPFLLREHLERFQRSANLIRLKMPYTLAEIEQIILEAVAKSDIDDAEVYFQLTRGIASRNHLFPNVDASFTLTVKPARVVAADHYEKGVGTLTVADERWAKCHVKSLNLLPNILAKQEAADQGMFEAILHENGIVTEGSSTNVFAVKNGAIYTTPLTSNILPGITRQAVIKLAINKKMNVVEEEFPVSFLKKADEVFLTSTTIEILPVKAIDKQMVNNGKPGMITTTLIKEFQKLYANNR